jgi:glucokinase
MILAGDIGGTKTNLALFEVKDDTLYLHTQHQFVSQNYPHFSEVIEEFLQLTSHPMIHSACFGIAGPIIDEQCRTTNLPWMIDARVLRESLQTQHVSLLNDLEATAYGMLYLREDELIDLNPSAHPTIGNRAVIAAGTGLGEAMLYFDGKHYHPSGSEGGHCDFAPLNTQQDALLQWLRQRYPNHVSYERIVSGPGISTVYDFLFESGFAPEPQQMMNLSQSEDRTAHISQCALQDNDPLCIETLRLFTEIYGAETGNLALKTMSLGGVYIGGGIAPKILPYIQSETFFNAFVRKGRFEPLLRNMSLKVSLNSQTALLGAAHFARTNLSLF